jgi:hypothetical protein
VKPISEKQRADLEAFDRALAKAIKRRVHAIETSCGDRGQCGLSFAIAPACV